MSNSFYRSEKMAYCEIFLQSEMAYSCVAELGELAITQFNDLNGEASMYQRKYIREIRECDEMERQLRCLENELGKQNIRINFDVEIPSAPLPKDIPGVKAKICDAQIQLLRIKESSSDMRAKRYELQLLRQTLDLTESYFVNTSSQSWANVAPDPEETILGPNAVGSPAAQELPTQLNYVCGVVTRERAATLERMLFRVSRGNVFFRSVAIECELEENPATGLKEELNVFLALFQGEVLKHLVLRICSAFHATMFSCPERQEERAGLRLKVFTQIEDMKTVLNQAQEQLEKLLVAIALDHWTLTIQVRKIKTVYHVLNMLNPDVTDTYLIGEFWCPEKDLPRLDAALIQACERSGGAIVGVPFIVQRMEETPKKVPTYFRTNKFTRAYHNIVSAYGVAAYREVNPALYTTITFPFLFSIMFGDAGHGVIVLAFGLWMVLKEKSLQKVADRQESFKMVFGGRYVILLMGIFSIHAGLIYNDIFSKAINIFQTQWHTDYSMHEIQHEESMTLTAANRTNYDQWPYPFGVDPIWMISENRIVYINAAKMKFSVIVGVVQMFFGLVLSLMNHCHFKNYLNILCEFIPQVLFISCIFVYMDVLIFYKWIAFNADRSGEAPSILIGMINMVLFKYSTDTAPDRWITDNVMNLQYALVIIAVISVPWMLVIKPLVLRRRAKMAEQHRRLVEQTSNNLINTAGIVAPNPAAAESSNPSNPPGFSAVFSSIEMSAQLRASFISRNLPVRSRSNTITSKASKVQARKQSVMSGGVSSAAANDDATSSGDSSSSSNGKETGGGASSESEDGEEKFEFGEVFIHQTIHTIEYVLGLISHTASYLRLWALSLAHAELSEVLWQMVLSRGFTMSSSGTGGFIAIVIIFVFWAVLTIAILCLMEGLSAFLHALRLQWVEFQSKFYGGDGVMFKPFSFKMAIRLKSE